MRLDKLFHAQTFDPLRVQLYEVQLSRHVYEGGFVAQMNYLCVFDSIILTLLCCELHPKSKALYPNRESYRGGCVLLVIGFSF